MVKMSTLQQIKSPFITNKQYQELVFIFLSFLFFFFLIILRPLNSTDTEGYFKYFQNASLKNPVPEKSFVIISLIAKFLGGEIYGFRIVLFIYATISIILLFSLLKKNSNPIIAFLVYFSFAYIYQMNIQIRSCIANLIFCHALYDIYDKNWKKYYIKIIIAFLFHNSSVLFFPIYPFCRFILRKRKLLIILPFLFVILAYFTGDIIFTFVSLGETHGFRALNVLKAYTQFSKYHVNPLNRFSLFIFFLHYFYIFCFPLKKITEKEIICLSILSISIFCYFFGAFNLPIIAERYPEVFNLVLVLFFPLIIKRVKEKDIFFVLFLIYIAIANMQYKTFETLLGYFL